MMVGASIHHLHPYRYRSIVPNLILCQHSSFTGRRGLSGSASCRWYINEDLPEINAIHARLVCNPLNTCDSFMILMCFIHILFIILSIYSLCLD